MSTTIEGTPDHVIIGDLLRAALVQGVDLEIEYRDDCETDASDVLALKLALDSEDIPASVASAAAGWALHDLEGRFAHDVLGTAEGARALLWKYDALRVLANTAAEASS